MCVCSSSWLYHIIHIIYHIIHQVLVLLDEQQAELSREASRNAQEVQQLLMANGELKARNEMQQAELNQMRDALVEIDRAIKRQNETITVSILIC